jgi:hypothetical protein
MPTAARRCVVNASKNPVGELEAARAASAALATRGLAMQSAEVSPSAVAAVMRC